MTWIQHASTSAQKADAVFGFAVGLSVAFLLLITGLMIAFAIRYRFQRHPRAAQIEGNTLLEILWTVVPLVLFLVIFYYGWTGYTYMSHPPRDAMVVSVTSRQWAWSFQYPNGKRAKVLYAPLGRPMKLEVTSADVIHGFAISAFRLKIDAVPSRVNTTWFQATRLGSYDIQCTVICGVDHSLMVSKVVVVPEAAFRAWYFGGEDAPEPDEPAKPPAMAPLEPKGLSVMRNKGCLGCHSVDGEPRVGPTLKGVLGRREEVMAGGQARWITVDEARLRRAIQAPGREPVRGYPPVMPETPLEAQDLAEVIGYLKALR